MTGIAVVVEECLIIDGVIRLKPFEKVRCESLKSVVLWDFIRTNKHQITCFSDPSWYSQGNKLSVTFNGLTPEFEYELKAMTLGLYTQGSGQGMEPLSWLSIRRLIANLKRLSSWLQSYKINSFSGIEVVPELKLRNIILDLVQTADLQKHPSFAMSILSAVYWLKKYDVVESKAFFELMNEYFSPFILLVKERRNMHSVIPVRIMKQVLKTCEKHVVKTEKAFDGWLKLQNKINQAIPSVSSTAFSKTTFVKSLNYAENAQIGKYHATIKVFRRYVFVLVLSYTGMRHSEVMALPEDPGFVRNNKFHLKSLLSKTTDDTQVLEWITNEITYRAVCLLVRINKVYLERAELLLAHHARALPEKRRLNLEFGLGSKTLFGVMPHKKSCGFAAHTKSTSNGFNYINKIFSIAVTESDIAELEKMRCNYQSVSSNHKKFKQPYRNGDYFNFTAHQFRHTFAWFIVANRLGDLDDIKYQYKHLDHMMTLVYSQRGYESMDELIRLTESFSEFMTSQAMEEIVVAAQDGVLAGKGGQNFILRLGEILEEDLTTGNNPHFNNMQELLEFASKHSTNFRGLSHGYCTKGGDCKVRNAADPSHCVSCNSYIATPRHLPHWLVVKKRCEAQLASFEKLPEELKQRFKSFSVALKGNFEAANIITKQLAINVKEA